MRKEHNNQRRSFLLKLALLPVAGGVVNGLMSRFISQKKNPESSVGTILYPTINPMAVARKKDKV
jgi:hypothetical protein